MLFERDISATSNENTSRPRSHCTMIRAKRLEKPVKTKSLTRLASGIFALGLTFCAGQSASAQERLPFSGGMGGDLAGAMLVKPGGILFSTFDANKDFEITEDEIEVGARQAFEAELERFQMHHIKQAEIGQHRRHQRIDDQL